VDRSGGGDREQDDHYGESEAVVEAAFDVEELSESGGDFFGADDGGGKDRVGGAEHGAEEEGVGPSEPAEVSGQDGDGGQGQG